MSHLIHLPRLCHVTSSLTPCVCCQVVLAANSLPAINDITAQELSGLLVTVAEWCPIFKAAVNAALQVCG